MQIDSFPLPAVCTVPGRVGGYIRTFSNVVMFPHDPRPDEILIEDIAKGLSQNCRWGGQCTRFYSVAEHSLLVSSLCPMREHKLACLLHDASEAYLQDIASPVKAALSEYKTIEHGLMKCIAEKFSFAWPKSEIVEFYDSLALQIEGNALFRPVGSFGGFPRGYSSLDVPSLNPHMAKQFFLSAFADYSYL